MTLFTSGASQFRLVKEKNQVLNMEKLFLAILTLPFIKGEVIGENCLAPSAPDNHHISVLSKCESMENCLFLFFFVLKKVATVEPGVSKLFGKRKKVYYCQVVYYLAGDLC